MPYLIVKLILSHLISAILLQTIVNEKKNPAKRKKKQHQIDCNPTKYNLLQSIELYSCAFLPIFNA